MSVYAIVWAYDQSITNSGQKFTLVTAAQYCNDEGICWVKQETLADDMSMGISTVRRHLDNLEKAEIIERIERRRKDGTRASDFIKLRGFQRNRSNRAGDAASTAQSEQINRSNRAGNKRQSIETSKDLRPNGRGQSPHEQEVESLANHEMKRIYDAMKGAGFAITREEYGKQVARVQWMLDNQNPSEGELELLPAAYVRVYKIVGPSVDAVYALNELRRQSAREEELAKRNGDETLRRPGTTSNGQLDSGSNSEEAAKKRKEDYNWLFEREIKNRGT